MKIVVFSDLKTIKTHFTQIKENRNFTMVYHCCVELKEKLDDTDKDAFIYIDISGHGVPENIKQLDYLLELNGYRYGLIDPDGVITDPAILFFRGASDYLGKEVLNEGITAERIKKATEFYGKRLPLSQRAIDKTFQVKLIPSGSNWSEIMPGKEYTFCLMYIELDKHVEMRKTMSEDLVKAIAESFKKYIAESISSANGRMWIWNKVEGLILFPFDGKTCDVVLTCFRMFLDRKMICVENLSFSTLFTFRIALHVGNTVYERRGSTNHVVSDSVNSIFHLGRKFTGPGNFHLTKEVFSCSPEGLKKYFLPAGQFESYDIMRMKLPL